MVRKMVVLVVLAGILWNCTAGLAKAASKSPQTKRVAMVFPKDRKVKGKSSKSIPTSLKAHYEVIEWCQGAEFVDPSFSGPFNQGEGKGIKGINTSAAAVVFSVTVYNGFNSAQVEPVTVRNLITVNWISGKDNASEPAGGLNLYFHHSSRTYAEASGAGVKDFVGSGHAKADAKTQGPGGSSHSQSEASAPLLGVECDPKADNSTYMVENVRSGWKGYISATVSVTSSSLVFGCGEAEAEAEITWEAEGGK